MHCKNCRYGYDSITDCISPTYGKFWLCNVHLLLSAISNRFAEKIAEKFGKKKSRAFPFFYALTGCHIPSAFFNQDKWNFGNDGQKHR